MKKIVLIICTFCFIIIISAQGLNSNASHIKENYPNEYSSNFKKHALDEWPSDFEMVAYTINLQADALFNLIQKFESENTNIVFRAIQEWSYEGYKSSNIVKFKELEAFELKRLVKLHCDWTMVEYTYDNQVNAKNAL